MNTKVEIILKECRICKKPFRAFKTTDAFCSYTCALEDKKVREEGLKAPRRKRLPLFSTTRRQENDKYSKMRRDFMKINVICAIGSPKCSSTCTEIHHIQGRIGKKLLDRAEWIATCRACHDYIHHTSEGIKWGKEKGFIKNRT